MPHSARLICRLLGHRREIYDAGHYFDRRGRLRERFHHRCTRCGTSDGGEVFARGIFERGRGYYFRGRWGRHAQRVKDWWRQDCEDCHKPSVRFGRPIGDHEDCDVIPF